DVDGGSGERAEAQRLAQRPGPVVVGERLAKAALEPEALANRIDRAVGEDSPPRDARRIAPHRVAAKEAVAAREVELPIVPLTGETGSALSPWGGGIALWRAALVDAVPAPAEPHAGKAALADLAQHRLRLGQGVHGSEIDPIASVRGHRSPPRQEDS